MNPPTDEQLKRAAAKMLPEKLAYDEVWHITARLRWRYDSSVNAERDLCVLDTELLAVCQMIEENFNTGQRVNLAVLLLNEVEGEQLGAAWKDRDYANMLAVANVIQATWQQRLTAIAKVLNVEVSP